MIGGVWFFVFRVEIALAFPFIGAAAAPFSTKGHGAQAGFGNPQP